MYIYNNNLNVDEEQIACLRKKKKDFMYWYIKINAISNISYLRLQFLILWRIIIHASEVDLVICNKSHCLER